VFIGIVGAVCTSLIVKVVLSHYHPIFYQMRTVLEQANIYQNGVLTTEQFDFLSHLSTQKIVSHTPMLMMIGGVVFILCLAYISLAEKAVFKFIFYLLLFITSLSYGDYIVFDKNNEFRLDEVVKYFPNEDLYLKSIQKDKNNKRLKRASYQFREHISKENLKKFFEEQKI
jgi:hypothetical protein